MKALPEYWYDSRPPLWLIPLSWLFRLLVWLRRAAYRFKIFSSVRIDVPVIIVGNISVGGTGKTPFVTWVVNRLREQGLSPGIITRGYGGQAKEWPQLVTSESDPAMVGDEPVLLAQRCGCPIVAAPDRVAAARKLLDKYDCNILISDDGLQHYRLGRDLELAVVDGERRFGNGKCLPAGPLREPLSRLEDVDFVIVNGVAREGEYGMQLSPAALHRLDGVEVKAISDFEKETVHAMAGIGNPVRFFTLLKRLKLNVIEHPYPDHYNYTASDLAFDGETVVMTEKDAVKCRPYAENSMWYLPVDAVLDDSFEQRFIDRINQLRKD